MRFDYVPLPHDPRGSPADCHRALRRPIAEALAAAKAGDRSAAAVAGALKAHLKLVDGLDGLKRETSSMCEEDQRTFLRGLPVETQTDLLANYIRSHDQTCLGFEPPGLCQESRIALFVISWPDMMAGGHPDAIDSFFLMGLRSAAHGMLYYQRHASKGYARAVTYLEGSMKLQFMPVMEAQSSVKSALHLFRITRRMLLSAYDMADDRTLLPADKTLLFMRTYDEGDDKAYTSYLLFNLFRYDIFDAPEVLELGYVSLELCQDHSIMNFMCCLRAKGFSADTQGRNCDKMDEAAKVLRIKLWWLPGGFRRLAQVMLKELRGVKVEDHEDYQWGCWGCGDNSMFLLRCGGCMGHMKTRYCSVQCQREHRSQHEEECCCSCSSSSSSSPHLA